MSILVEALLDVAGAIPFAVTNLHWLRTLGQERRSRILVSIEGSVGNRIRHVNMIGNTRP